MGTETAFTVLSSLLSILGITYLLFWRYRALCTDWFRQRVFELRDELFDYAAEGNISFDNPNYGMLRKAMNGHIRFAHQTNGWHGLIFAAFFRKADRQYIQEAFEYDWVKASAKLPPETRQKIEDFRGRLETLTGVYFIISAPDLVLLLLPVVLVLLLLLLAVTMSVRVGLFVAQPPLPRWTQNIKRRLRIADDVAMLYGA